MSTELWRPVPEDLENLRWDTAEGNWADKVLHGTSNHGERNNTTKLTAADVLAIRASTSPASELAVQYGVHETTLRRAKAGRTWQHLHHAREYGFTDGAGEVQHR